MITTDFVKKALFGGAARCDIPSNWIDASTIRDVPSFQEVFMEKTGERDHSVIVEVLQYEHHVEDANAPVFFFEDLAMADGSTENHFDHSRTIRSETLFLGTKANRMTFEGTHQKSKSGPRSEPSKVGVFMTLIRSKAFEADILITCHAVVDEFGMNEMRAIHKRISGSLEFLDPTLFG
jgi:hypothetical protein